MTEVQGGARETPQERGQPEGTARPATPAGCRFGAIDGCWVMAIVAAAFALRVIYVLQLRASPYFALHVMDPGYHHEWARAFAAGQRFWDGPYFRAPLYPWFLGVIYRLFGPDNPLAPRLIQAGIGALSCGLLYLIGRQCFSRSVGIIAGLAAATYWMLLYFDAELLIEVLSGLLNLLLLWLLLRTGRRPSPAGWGGCGLVLGLSAIARPNILLLAPALVVWIFVLHRPHRRRGLGAALCLTAGAAAPILPITVRNYVVGHDLVLIASQGGVNFYIGNNPSSDGMSAVIRGDPGEWRACYQAQLARVRQALGHEPKASEVSRWYTRQALRFMWEQPGKAARLMLKKLGYFWSHWEVSNNQDIRFITSHYTPIVRWLPLRFWLVGPLGALGVVLALRRGRELFPLWGFVLIYMASVVLFFVTARYRIAVVPALLLLGSYAVCWCRQALAARRWRALAGAALVLAGMGTLAARTPPGVDRDMLQEHRETGHTLVQLGRLEEGEQILGEYVRRARAAGRAIDPDTWYALGYARLKLGRLGAAIECFEQALAGRPLFPEARNNLGVALAAAGRLEQAAAEFERLIREAPDSASAHANLASAVAQLGQLDRAIEHFRRALALDAASRATLVQTVESLRRRGDAAGAQRLLDALREPATRPGGAGRAPPGAGAGGG